LSKLRDDGYLFMSGIRFSHVATDLSVQPDLVFVSFAAIQQDRIKLVRGQLGGYVELEGSPELVVEIISPSSVRKDTEVLRELYALAGIAEYWLIDARSASPTLQILELKDGVFQPTPVV
jgi:Uma2 family endonuclease